MLIATHNGPFHADDVFAVALLVILYPKAEVLRTRDKELLKKADIVLDVGMVFEPLKGRFDHHMDNGAGQRENGVYYSAIGLIWQKYGERFCENNSEVTNRIDQEFIAQMDAIDNGQELFETNDFGIKPTLIDGIINLYNPTFLEKQDFDAQFFVAVDWAKQILQRVKQKYMDNFNAEQHVKDLLAHAPDRRCLVMDQFLPIGRVAESVPDLLYVIYPGVNGDWVMRAVSKKSKSFESRKLLPAAWAGLEGSEFAAISGVDDVAFCHRNLFICGAKTKQAILKLLKLALDG